MQVFCDRLKEWNKIIINCVQTEDTKSIICFSLKNKKWMREILSPIHLTEHKYFLWPLRSTYERYYRFLQVQFTTDKPLLTIDNFCNGLINDNN